MRKYNTAVSAFDDIMDAFSAVIEMHIADENPGGAADYYEAMLEFEDAYGQDETGLPKEKVNQLTDQHRTICRAADVIHDLLGIITKVRPQNESAKIVAAEAARIDLLNLHAKLEMSA